MREAIVTGANGFVGRHLIRQLINNGYEVFAVVRQNRFENIKDLNVHIVECDMDNISGLYLQIPKLKDPVFYHLAWEGNSGDARKDYRLQLINAYRTVEAAKAAKQIGCKNFVAAGSVTQLLYRDYLKEDGITPEMVTCYAVGKMTAEFLLKCVCAEEKINLCWCYIANFYGEDDTTNNFINFLIDNYSNDVVPVLTPAEQLADFIHVDDVARALIILGEKVRDSISVYVGYGEPRPLKEYIEIIHNKIAPNIQSGVGLKKFEGKSVDYSLVDYKKMERQYGFLPHISFEQGIDSVIATRINKDV